jgi:integrase
MSAAQRARLVALSAATAQRLGDWYAEAVVAGGADAAGYVWPGKDGGPMHDRSAYRALERAAHRAGLEVTRPGRHTPQALVTLHGLRHTAGSLMLLGGVPITVVSAQLGHADTAITGRIYAHLVSDRDLDLAAAVFEGPISTGTMEETMEEEGPES